MQCCVPNCASNELKPNKSENSGITYHEFPKDSQTRSRWLQSLQLGDWRPNANSVVCSLHFRDENFVQPELHAVKTDGEEVPVTFEMNIEENTKNIIKGNLCRICLCSDTKVYNIGENDIAQQYEFLTARKVCLGDGLPQHICWECKARLASFARLRSVALRSLEILQVFYETVKSQEINQDLQLIVDRDTIKIASTLIRSKIEVVDYPPKGVLGKKPNNTVSFNLRSRNDNDKSTKLSTVSNKGKNIVVKKENDNFDSGDANDNLGNRINEFKALNKVKNENDNSDLSDVSDYFENCTKVSKACNKGKNSTKVKNENDNSKNLEDDNFADSKNETASKNSDEVYNSGLEDVIYDSDGSKSENEDINRKLDSHLTRINSTFDDKKVSLIKRGINMDCNRIKKGKSGRKSQNEKELEETFSIKHFTKEEQLKEFLQRKESDNYKNSGFKCDICYRGFLHEKTFKSHQIKHTDVNGSNKCPLCGINFRKVTKLRAHLKESHQYRYSCKKCDYVTCALSKTKLHIKFHKGTIYNCSQCDKTFKQHNSLLGHIRIHHTSGIVCNLCGNSFVNEKGLHNHKLIIHKLDSMEVPEDGPRCVECDIQFSTDTALTTHYQESNKHKNKKDMLPENESRKRSAPSASKPVYSYKNPPAPRKRGNQGPVNCELCDMVLPTFMKYYWHFKKYHPDKVRTQYPGSFMCEICGVVFLVRAQLEEHKNSHSDIKKYSCEECGKKFKLKQSLYVHKEKHSENKLACDICGKTFAYFRNMLRHKILHEDQKFDCNICGKSFKHPQNRQSHITYVHLKKPLPVRKDRVRAKREKIDSAE